jgi:organic hydroperoxide reductase OsmC/OhrA
MTDVFTSHLDWIGSANGPTLDPLTFSRDLSVRVGDDIVLPMSSAPGYRGDPSRINPEQLFVAAISACQALTFLFLAARSGIAVVKYRDAAEGRLSVVDGKLRMSHVTLRPSITLESGADEAKARALVDKAHGGCFIGNSVVTTVTIEPSVQFVEAPAAVA